MASATASQKLLQIKAIRDGVIILKNDSMRAVLMASSLNFALKSADEQTAIIMQYENFLNSLDFSVQFFVQSRKLNIEPYINLIKESERRQTNDLLKIQIREYIDFIRTFVRSANIVTKSFYIIVPYTPTLFKNTKQGWQSLLDNIKGSSKQKQKAITAEAFEEHKNQLWQRVNAVIGGLARSDVRTVPLNTEEIIELFYGLYNPGELEKGKPPPITT
jgi:hypothetical protein